MSDFGLTIDSNTSRLVLHFDQMPAALQRKLKIVITQLTRELLARVKAAEPVRTGRLRSATHSYVDERKNFVRGRVRIRPTGKAQAVAAAFGALEYGAPGKRRHGKVPVRAYSRSGVAIRSHERRRPRIAARRFLRGPATAMRTRVKAELAAAIGQAVKEFDFSTVK